MIFLGQFMHKGLYTFEVVARLADEKCLFAVTLTQWLEGGIKEAPLAFTNNRST
jgi:hypothetical protein